MSKRHVLSNYICAPLSLILSYLSSGSASTSVCKQSSVCVTVCASICRWEREHHGRETTVKQCSLFLVSHSSTSSLLSTEENNWLDRHFLCSKQTSSVCTDNNKVFQEYQTNRKKHRIALLKTIQPGTTKTTSLQPQWPALNASNAITWEY